MNIQLSLFQKALQKKTNPLTNLLSIYVHNGRPATEGRLPIPLTFEIIQSLLVMRNYTRVLLTVLTPTL